MTKKKPAATTGSYVCGIAVADIRRAYFDGKIDELCANIMASQSVGAEDIKALGAELEKLKTEELEFRRALKAEVTGPLFKDDEGRPPTLAELMESEKPLTPEQQAQVDEWRKQRDWSVDTAKQIIRVAAKNALNKVPLNRDRLMDDAHAMDGLRIWLSEDMREKERLYKKRIIEIIDGYEVSRREAQDRAEVTNAYVEFKKAEDLYSISESFIQNAKKRYGGQFGG